MRARGVGSGWRERVRERKIERDERGRGEIAGKGGGQGRGSRVAGEKGGNGARYGEMARKLGIVTGNGRPPTPLTERKLVAEETVGGQPLPGFAAPRRSANVPYNGDKRENELEYLTNENRGRDR